MSELDVVFLQVFTMHNLLIKGPLAHKQWPQNLLELLKFVGKKHIKYIVLNISFSQVFLHRRGRYLAKISTF